MQQMQEAVNELLGEETFSLEKALGEILMWRKKFFKRADSQVFERIFVVPVCLGQGNLCADYFVEVIYRPCFLILRKYLEMDRQGKLVFIWCTCFLQRF